MGHGDKSDFGEGEQMGAWENIHGTFFFFFFALYSGRPETPAVASLCFYGCLPRTPLYPPSTAERLPTNPPIESYTASPPRRDLAQALLKGG